MTSARDTLLPYMRHYSTDLEDLTYLEFFQYGDRRCEVSTTDRFGFRFSHGPDGRYSVGTLPPSPVSLLAGSSTAFGFAASSDAATIPSRLWLRHAPALPWLSFAGQAHNSAQELLAFVLFRHLLPQVEEIVLFSGVNNLVLSRLPAQQQGHHGAIFECGPPPPGSPVPTLSARISLAAELTVRHLEGWSLLAAALGARLSFVLQPLAPWVRERPSPEEQRLFDELDQRSSFMRVHQDIGTMDTGRAYAEALRLGCEKIGVPFLDLNPVLAEEIAPADWMFVDRVHLTDRGYDTVARLLADQLELS